MRENPYHLICFSCLQTAAAEKTAFSLDPHLEYFARAKNVILRVSGRLKQVYFRTRARRRQCAWAFAENISADLSQTSLPTVCYFTMTLRTTNCFWAPNRFRTPAFSVFDDTSPCQCQFQPQVVVSRCHLVAKSSHFALLILLRHLSKVSLFFFN